MNSAESCITRLTAECTFQYFIHSGKRHLFLTGDRGSGKTTLLNKVLPLLSPTTIPGITTWAIPARGVFLKDNLTEETAQIGAYIPAANGQSHRMQPLPLAFEQLGCRLLEQHIHSCSEWVSIDEIGYLESSCQRYCQDILNLLEQKRVVAILRKKDLSFLNDLRARQDVCVIDLDNPNKYLEQ